MNTLVKRTAVMLTAILVAGCASHKLVQQGDTLARVGDWETALVQYRMAVEKNPDDLVAKRRMDKAEREVIDVYVKRGNKANSEGHLAEAGMWWRKAILMTPDYERTQSSAWTSIEKNQTALEYAGDVAAGEMKHEEAMGVYGALLLVTPDQVELTQKHLESQRAFASSLHAQADALARRNLVGAALVTNLRALRYDPLQNEAFSDGNGFKRTLRSRTRVAIQEIRLDDKGYKGLAAPLLQRMVPHMEDYAPYGPTKDPGAVRAEFRVTIESFDKKEETKDGADELVNDEQPSTIPIPNPAIPEQRKKIASLEQKLAQQQTDLKRALAKRKQNGGAAATDPGLELARAIDKTKIDIASSKAQLAKMPEKVAPPPPPATWTLPWKETTRTVVAAVKFEVIEPDFPDPIVIEMTETITRTDRTHDGDRKHRVDADPLALPPWEDMVAELATKLSAGRNAIELARARRVNALIDRGRQQLTMRNDDEALDAFVAVLFMMGPAALPEDCAAFVAKELENDRLKDVVAMQ